MKFLEKHIHGFFILNLGVLLFMSLYFIVGTYQIAGWPNAHTNWDFFHANWQKINSLWLFAVINAVIYFIFAILCFKRWYFVFILIAVYLDHIINDTFMSLIVVIYHARHEGFSILNLYGFLCLIQFSIALVGILLWLNHLPKNKWYQCAT